MNIANNIRIKELKELYISKQNSKETSSISKMRLFFNGRELKDERMVAEYDIPNENVIQVFLIKN